jgi:hypothetical protein
MTTTDLNNLGYRDEPFILAMMWLKFSMWRTCPPNQKIENIRQQIHHTMSQCVT